MINRVWFGALRMENRTKLIRWIFTAHHTYGWVTLGNIKVCTCPCLCGCECVDVRINLEPLFLSSGTYLYPQNFGAPSFWSSLPNCLILFCLFLWLFISHTAAVPACMCFSVSPRSPGMHVRFPQRKADTCMFFITLLFSVMLSIIRLWTDI